MLVKDLITNLQNLNPDDDIFVTYYDKSDLETNLAERIGDWENEYVDNLSQSEYDKLVKEVTELIYADVLKAIKSDVYYWEVFSEVVSEAEYVFAKEVLEKLTEQRTQDTELWEG